MNEYIDYNWCPDCGEPRGVCACEENREAYEALYGDEERNMPAWEMYPLEIDSPDVFDGLRVCVTCGQYECVAPATKCWRCREQEMIDEL